MGHTQNIEKTVGGISILVSGLDGVVTLGGFRKTVFTIFIVVFFKETFVFIVSIAILGVSFFDCFFEVFLDFPIFPLIIFSPLILSRQLCR